MHLDMYGIIQFFASTTPATVVEYYTNNYYAEYDVPNNGYGSLMLILFRIIFYYAD